MSEGVLAGKTILVTGAGGGIGAEIRREVTRQSGRLVMTDIQPTTEALAAELNACFLPLDVAREEEWAQVAARVEREFGALHGLVNNAGKIRMKSLLETTLDVFCRVLRGEGRNPSVDEGGGARVRAARHAHPSELGTSGADRYGACASVSQTTSPASCRSCCPMRRDSSMA